MVEKLEADGIEGDWKGASRKTAQDIDLADLSEEELKKIAIRDNMKAENDAIMMYTKYIDMLPEGDAVRTGLEDIRDEEKEHAGELHKLLIDLDPSEEDEFEEGIGEVEREGRAKSADVEGDITSIGDLYRLYKDLYKGENAAADEVVDNMWRLVRSIADDAGVYTYVGKKENGMDEKEASRLLRNKAARRLHAKAKTAKAKAKTAGNYSAEYPGGDGSLAVLSEDGVWFVEDADGNVVAEGESDYEEDAKGEIEEAMGKTASAGLADQIGRHDQQVPFYAYYEGQTKDRKATIGVVQQQIGSKPQLAVVSEKGQVHDFGFMPNMDYAMRQAERFEKMTYNELMAVAPPKTVRVTTAAKAAQSDDYMLLDRLRSDNDYFLGNGGRSEKHLWAGNVDDQIAKMRELWNGLDEKPEWLTEEQIDDYERRMKEGAKTAQYAEGWNKVDDGYWYKYVGSDGSTINVSWVGWTNLPGNLYYDERGCYAYYDGVIDGEYNGSLEVARAKTISIAGLPREAFDTMSYDEILAKYDNPEDGFCEKLPAVEYCAKLADEWLAQNEQHLPSKTASDDGWDEQDGVWGKYVEPYSLEIDYDYSAPGKYHWEAIDMSKGGVAGEKAAEGDEDTLEGAQSAATQVADAKTGKVAASEGHDTGRTTQPPEGWTRFETMVSGALGSPWRFTGDGKIVNAEVEADGTYNWYWVTEDVGVKGYPRKGYFPSAQAAIDDALSA